jgi:Ca-activated chloride channel family protein
MATDKKMKSISLNVVDPGYILIGGYLLAMALLVLLGWCGSAGASIPGPQEVTLDDVHRGQLLLPGKEAGQYLPSPMLAMEVDISISGIAARTSVTQKFTNPSKEWIEALYVFPLPDECAVDHLQMQIGDRVILGRIQKKAEAQKTYEAAKKAGKKTSLLSQQRPNIFTTVVANIAPGEVIIVHLEYQQIVKRQDRLFSLRFPMVVGPRYHPGVIPPPDPTTISFTDTDTTRMTISPQNQPVNPITLHINLAAGMELSRVDSLYHGIRKQKNTDNTLDIHFTGEVKADRDFVLEWEPVQSRAPMVSLFSEQQGEENFMLLMVMPPEQTLQQPLAREILFILDTSGSMGGESIRQAKKALLMAITRIRPEDRFNIIEFNSVTNSLFSTGKPGTRKNVQQAASYIHALDARGGTEIKPALELALDGKNSHERIRQIVFLTDGCVGNEEELFALIHQRLGDTRLFTVGIGSAPNSYFMTRAAAMGRGSYTFIGKLSEVQEKMTTLFTMLEQPAITNLVLSGGNINEMLPSPLPDLYQGEPLLAFIRAKKSQQNIQISGLSGGRTPWQLTLDGTSFTDRPGIAALWARKKIRILMDSLSVGVDPEQVKKQVTRLALNNHLVSRYTSLVAVEEQLSRPEDKKLNTNRMKTNLPAGWQQNTVFAGSAATATPSRLLIGLGFLLLLLAATMARLNKNR